MTTTRARCRPGRGDSVFRQHAGHDVLVDVDPKREREDAGNPRTAEPRIARLELDDGLDERRARSLRSRLRRALLGYSDQLICARSYAGSSRSLCLSCGHCHVVFLLSDSFSSQSQRTCVSRIPENTCKIRATLIQRPAQLMVLVGKCCSSPMRVLRCR